jgi:hypothetical protein
MQTPGKDQIKHVVLRLESSQRDASSYPETNAYRVDLPQSFPFVCGMELVNAIVPITQHPIHDGNNMLEYTVAGSVKRSLAVSPGSYSASALTTAIDGALQDGLAVAYDGSTQQITFSHATKAFDIHVRTSTLRHALGMGSVTASTVSSSSGAYTPPGTVDVRGSPYIRVVCTDIVPPVVDTVSPGLGVLRTDASSSKDATVVPSPPIMFGVMKATVRSIGIRLENPDGTLYDTGQQNHTLLLTVYLLDREATTHASGR